MDDVIFTENIHKLIEKSHKYQSSKSNFFQTNKQTFKRGPIENIIPTLPNAFDDNKKNEKKFKVICSTFKSDSLNHIDYQKAHNKTLSEDHTPLGSAKGKNQKSILPAQTFMINLANQNLENFPSLDHTPSQVQLLDLQDNRLKTFPKQIYSLVNLKVLNLNSNFIKVLPIDIYDSFAYIQSFSINNNLVPNIHYNIENWASHLNYLDVSNNRIDSINTLTKLTELLSLFIHSNEFQILSYNLVKLTKLKEFSLDWFKYIQPPLKVTQQEAENINKLFDIIRLSQLAKFEDPSVINVAYFHLQKISSDDMEQEEGIHFKEFIQYFSKSDLPQSLPTLQSTIIHKAAIEQDIGVLLTVIHEYSNLIDQEDSNGYTPLALAIKEEKYFSAKTLIFNGANVNKSKTSHGSVLNLAIVKGQIHMISDLLQHNADPKRVDQYGNSAMHYCMATFDKDTKIFSKTLNLLLKYGVNPNILNMDGWTAMHLAVKKGVHEAVQIMISHNNNTSQKIKFDFSLRGGKKGSTSLHIAAQDCNFEITQILLLSEGINALCRNNADQIPSQHCPHNYKQYKLLKRYEYKQISQMVLMRKNNLQDQIYAEYQTNPLNQFSEDNKDETDVRFNQIWKEVLGWQQISRQYQLKHEASKNNTQQRLFNQLDHIQGYSSQITPNPLTQPNYIEDIKSGIADCKKTYHLRNQYVSPKYYLQPSVKKQGNILTQIDQPKHETSFDGPLSPSYNESYQDEDQQNFEEMTIPKIIGNIDNLENIFLSELLVKVQRNQQVSQLQKTSLLQLIQSSSLLTSYEALQSLAILQSNKPNFLETQ